MCHLNFSETILFAFGIIAVLPTLLRPEDYTTEDKSRAAPIPGICIGIRPITAFFDGIGISLVCYTSTNSVICTLFPFFKVIKLNYQRQN